MAFLRRERPQQQQQQQQHSNKECEPFWKKDFKMSHSFYSHGTSAARGVAIFLSIKENFEIIQIQGMDSYSTLTCMGD
jgi:hypothetical protein